MTEVPFIRMEPKYRTLRVGGCAGKPESQYRNHETEELRLRPGVGIYIFSQTIDRMYSRTSFPPMF